MTLHTRQLGRYGESCTCTYLKQNGYSLVARNYHTPRGEVDIIAKKAGVLIFVEVKLRSHADSASAEECFTPRKLSRMNTLAELWMTKNSIHPDTEYRLDAVILIQRGKHFILQHYQGIGE